MPFGKIVAFSDGKSGWLASPQGNMPLAGPQLKQIKGEIFHAYLNLLLSDHDPDRTVALAAGDTLSVTSKDGESAQTPDRRRRELWHRVCPLLWAAL